MTGYSAAHDDEYAAAIDDLFGISTTHVTPALYHHTCQKWPYALLLARGSVCEHCGHRVGIESVTEVVAGEMTHTVTEAK